MQEHREKKQQKNRKKLQLFFFSTVFRCVCDCCECELDFYVNALWIQSVFGLVRSKLHEVNRARSELIRKIIIELSLIAVLNWAMSVDETIVKSFNKRKVENDDDADDEDEAPCKKGRISPPAEDAPSRSELNHSRKSIEEAIKALDRIQYELNMGNVLAESPESSDHDTPPESEDESAGEDMMSQAHALGFAACIRETFRFLDSCGIPIDDPIYQQLKSRFVETSNWWTFCRIYKF